MNKSREKNDVGQSFGLKDRARRKKLQREMRAPIADSVTAGKERNRGKVAKSKGADLESRRR